MSDKQLAELEKIHAGINELNTILSESLKWIKFQGMTSVKKIFKEELDTNTKKIVYELSDGNSSNEIAGKVSVHPTTVRDWWHKWADLGVMELCPKYRRRYCKLFSLQELGIEVPDYNDVEK